MLEVLHGKHLVQTWKKKEDLRSLFMYWVSIGQSPSWKSSHGITSGVSFKPITKLRSRCVTRELRPCIWNFFWPVVLFCRQFIFRQNKTVTKNILTILRFPQELRSWRHRIVAGHQHSKVLTEPSRKTHEKQGWWTSYAQICWSFIVEASQLKELYACIYIETRKKCQ